ncbi:PDZ domain-containing protein [Nostocoides sp. HKS02]|uniref:YlbL family protein n=1 Tax=Nostocoides sp. HKS02 TaxID=1813880 RepID=UPI001E3633C9|nr:PDZ domain-containing protein [Tetrasphaera sp. HKS02]
MTEDIQHQPVISPTNPVDPHALTRRSIVALVASVVVIILAALSVMVGLPYVVLKPGPIANTLGKLSGTQLITVSGAPTYPTDGALDFTTVRLVGGPGTSVTVWDLLAARLSSEDAIEPVDLYFPQGVTDKQVQEQNTAEMVDSQQEAIAVALKATGHQVTPHLIITDVAKDAPSASVLRAGDELVSIDGTPVSSSDTVRTLVGRHHAGDFVQLRLIRGGVPVTAAAKTRSSGGRTTIGVFLGMRFTFPFDVKINAGSIGGPSAGTMFALGIYDLLTPGPLTGGQKIAGTGTIDYTGQVGPIGGIRQKLAGAHDGGAHWFLAPASNCDEVVGHVPDGLRVVKIATFDQARKAVEAIAAGQASGLPTCTH